MAIKFFYIGTQGPYFYDDTDDLLGPDGNFPGVTSHVLVTDGQLIVEGAPSEDNNLVRLIDLYEKKTELFIVTGTIAADTMVAYAIGTFDLFLPTLANAEKREINVKNIGTGIVTLKPNATESSAKIEGEIYQPLSAGDCATVISDISDWWVI